MTISLNSLTQLPTPPAKTDPANFALRADQFLGALPGFVAQANAMIVELNKITSGLDQSTPIAGWSSGVTYNFPDVVAGSDGYSYRCVSTTVSGINPVGDITGKWVNLSRPRGGPPIGSVIPYIGGYFSGSNNSGFVAKVGNTAAAINALVSADGWRVCDGSACSVTGPIFEGQGGRYLPNLTDDRFIKGGTAGLTGGSNSSSHTHNVTHTHDISHNHDMPHAHVVDVGSFLSSSTTLSANQIPAHTHPLSGGFGLPGSQVSDQRTEGGVRGNAIIAAANETTGQSHNHAIDPPAVWSSDASPSYTSTLSASVSSTVATTAVALDNRPSFLSCWFLMKVQG